MKNIKNRVRLFLVIAMVAVALSVATPILANHSWGGYHWARTQNPFTLKLGDNLTAAWDSYLVTASNQWSTSTVLDTSVVAGRNKTPKNCRPTAGRVEACNAAYGNNGWLGLASIWTSGTHIVQGTVKLNDTYFKTSTYNKPAWKNLVMCQEVAHVFGLDHQDEDFSNSNLGSCMDYTNDPDGSIYGQLSNVAPNAHDFEELETIYNSHLDTTSTVSQATSTNGNGFGANFENPSEWGRLVRNDSRGKPALFERDLGNGNKVFTFVTWTPED